MSVELESQADQQNHSAATVIADGNNESPKETLDAEGEMDGCSDSGWDFYKPKVRDRKVRDRRVKRNRPSLPHLPIYVYRQTNLTQLPETEYEPREIDQLTGIFAEKVRAALEIGNHSLAAKLVRNVARSLHARVLDEIDEDGMNSIENRINVEDVTAVVKFLKILSVFLKERGLYLEKLEDDDWRKSDAPCDGITKRSMVKSLPVGITELTIRTLDGHLPVGKLLLITPRSRKQKQNKRRTDKRIWSWRYERRYGKSNEESGGARGGRRIGIITFAEEGINRGLIAKASMSTHFMAKIWGCKEKSSIVVDGLQRDIDRYANAHPRTCELFVRERKNMRGRQKSSKKLKAYLNRNLEFFCHLLLDVAMDCSRQGKFKTRTPHTKNHKENKEAKIAAAFKKRVFDSQLY